MSGFPCDIGAKRRKVGTGQEKPDKNAHVSTVNIAVSPSFSDTISLSSPPPNLFRIKQSSIVQVINFMLAIIILEKSISYAPEN